MGNAVDVVSETSSERLNYRAWREPGGGADTPPHLKGGRKSVYMPSPALGPTVPQGRMKKSMSTGNLADHSVFPPGDPSLQDHLNAMATESEEVDLELAAFRKLCHDVTTNLIGPQFIATAFTPTPPATPTTSQAPVSTSVQSTAPSELLQSSPPPPKLVVNHLYHPVLQKVKEHLGGLPDWYLLKTQADEAASHIRLLLEARKYGEGQVAVSVNPFSDDTGVVAGMYVVVVCAKDRRQLLDAITRCVSQRASIIEATIITTRDGFALDRFVMKREEESDHGGSNDSEDDVSFWGAALKRDIDEVISTMQPSPQVKPRRRGTNRLSRPLSATSKPAWEVPFQEIRLIRVLGQGRTGRTFLAEWRGERVAAKVLSLEDESTNSGIRLEQFQSELALVSRLDHPNVVKFIGASARPPRYIILFELCEGDVLTMFKQKTKKFSFFQVALGAAAGLQYLHRNQIIHRDVKPENLMLDKLGRVKVVDFGLSCYAGEKTPSERTAETGTYRYMAPEVMLHQTYSFPADVFSFGLVLWCLLTRKVPFEESTPLQTAMAVSRQGTRPKMPSSCPAPLATLIKACWDADPAVRPSFDTIITLLQSARASLTKKDKAVLDPE